MTNKEQIEALRREVAELKGMIQTLLMRQPCLPNVYPCLASHPPYSPFPLYPNTSDPWCGTTSRTAC
jgi:hypothetical protein